MLYGEWPQADPTAGKYYFASGAGGSVVAVPVGAMGPTMGFHAEPTLAILPPVLSSRIRPRATCSTGQQATA